MIKAGTASLARLEAKSEANGVASTSTPAPGRKRSEFLSPGLACNFGCSCCNDLKKTRLIMKRVRANRQQTTDANKTVLTTLELLKTKMKEQTENSSRMTRNLQQQLKQKELDLHNMEEEITRLRQAQEHDQGQGLSKTREEVLTKTGGGDDAEHLKQRMASAIKSLDIDITDGCATQEITNEDRMNIRKQRVSSFEFRVEIRFCYH
jgi:hypothetical protein